MRTREETIDNAVTNPGKVIRTEGNVKRIYFDKEVLASIVYKNGSIEKIEDSEINLIYDKNAILYDSEEYFFTQIIEHDAYKQALTNILGQAHTETKHARKIEREIKEGLEEDAQGYSKFIRGIEKAIVTINCWWNKKSINGIKRRMTTELEAIIIYNHTMKDAITDRKEYIESMLPQIQEHSSTAYTDAIKLIKIQNEIITIHDEILQNAGEQLNIYENYVNKWL